MSNSSRVRRVDRTRWVPGLYITEDGDGLLHNDPRLEIRHIKAVTYADRIILGMIRGLPNN